MAAKEIRFSDDARQSLVKGMSMKKSECHRKRKPRSISAAQKGSWDTSHHQRQW